MIPLLLALATPPPVVEIPAVVTPPVVVGPDAKPAKARPFVMRYADLFDRIQRKKPTKANAVAVSVGQDEKGYERIDDVPTGVKPGLYRCWYEDGEPRWEAVPDAKPLLPRVFDPPVIPRLVPSVGQS